MNKWFIYLLFFKLLKQSYYETKSQSCYDNHMTSSSIRHKLAILWRKRWRKSWRHIYYVGNCQATVNDLASWTNKNPQFVTYMLQLDENHRDVNTYVYFAYNYFRISQPLRVSFNMSVTMQKPLDNGRRDITAGQPALTEDEFRNLEASDLLIYNDSEYQYHQQMRVNWEFFYNDV